MPQTCCLVARWKPGAAIYPSLSPLRNLPKLYFFLPNRTSNSASCAFANGSGRGILGAPWTHSLRITFTVRTPPLCCHSQCSGSIFGVNPFAVALNTWQRMVRQTIFGSQPISSAISPMVLPLDNIIAPARVVVLTIISVLFRPATATRICRARYSILKLWDFGITILVRKNLMGSAIVPASFALKSVKNLLWNICHKWSSAQFTFFFNVSVYVRP